MMNKLMSLISAAALMTAVPMTAADSLDANPGYIDFSKYVSVSTEDTTVEVNIKGPLLKLASSILEDHDEGVARLIENIQLVRVHVFEVDDENREQFAESIQSIAKTLTDKNWEQVVRVQEDDENVGVFTNMPTDDAIAGIVVSVAEEDEAVFVNIVGNVAIESIADLGKRLNIPKLDKIGEMLEEKS